MATNKIPMRYELYQNENRKSSSYGKWYARPVVDTTLSLKGFAKHLHDHNGTYRTSTIKGVIEEMVECLVEMVSQGVGVKLDGLGTFYPTFESEGAETQEEFDVNKQLKGIHLRFLPEGTKLPRCAVLCGPQAHEPLRCGRGKHHRGGLAGRLRG